MDYNIVSPLKEANHIIKQLRRNAYSTRKTYLSVAHKAIKDLYRLKRPINSAQEITNQHVAALVSKWKEESISSGTIANRVSILAKFLDAAGNTHKIASAKELGAIRESSAKKGCTASQEMYSRAISRVHTPFVKYTIELQVLLGFDKREAIKISPTILEAYDELIVVPRDIALSGRDRVVPIVNDAQRVLITALKGLMGNSLSWNQAIPLNQLYSFYNTELIFAGLSIKTPFRSLYAKTRFHQLVNCGGFERNKVFENIQQEMGITTKSILKRWVNE